MYFERERFSEDRKSKGITIEQLAGKSGVSENIIKNMESGRRGIKRDTFNVLCDTLGLDADSYWKRETKVIPALSHKGGSGKSSTAGNLAYALAQKGMKCLLVDADSQGNLTQSYNMMPNDEKNFYKAFNNNESLMKHIQPTSYENIDMVVFDEALLLLDIDIIYMDFREERMKKILEEVVADGIYDYIIIDCHPSLNLLNRAILYASDSVIIPLVPSAFGIRGVEYLLKYTEGIKKNHPKFEILGVLFNNVDKRKSLHKYLTEEKKPEELVGCHYLFKTIIPTDTKIEEAQYFCKPVGALYKYSRGSKAYSKLGDEVVERIKSTSVGDRDA